MSRLQTSPLLFLRPGNRVTIEGRPVNFKLQMQDIELLSFFNEPASDEEALTAGYEIERIEQLVKAGLLVSEAPAKSFCRGGTWEVYNLQRAAYLMFNTVFDNEADSTFRSYQGTSEDIMNPNFGKMLNRRTERFFTDENISQDKFEELIKELNSALASQPWLSYRVLVQGIDGYDKSIYMPDAIGKLTKTVNSYTKKDLMEAVHGQWWLNGAGFCFFLVVNFDELKKKNANSNPKSYFEMILQLGAAGQALLNTVYKHELGSWMTPAVSESMAAKILGLDPDKHESLYFFKVGIPQRAEDKNERRSPI